jgi:hypothetical protein
MRQARGDARSVLITNEPREQKHRQALPRAAAGKRQVHLHRPQPAKCEDIIRFLLPVVVVTASPPACMLFVS